MRLLLESLLKPVGLVAEDQTPPLRRDGRRAPAVVGIATVRQVVDDPRGVVWEHLRCRLQHEGHAYHPPPPRATFLLRRANGCSR